jgi:hypothetical protein
MCDWPNSRWLAAGQEGFAGAVLLALALLTVAVCPQALAADTIVLGHALSDKYIDKIKIDCPADEICLDVWYRWIIEADQTVSGPRLPGRVVAAQMQHVDVTHAFLKSLRLFVLRPIDDQKQRSLLGADYYLVDMSKPSRMYCLWSDPKAEGLSIDEVFVAGEEHSSRYCFVLPGRH